MKHAMLVSCFLALASLTAAPVSYNLDDWNGNPFSWSSTQNSIMCESNYDTLSYRKLPQSDTMSIQATVNVKKRMIPAGYAVAGVALYNSGSNFYHIALVETPDGHHFIELHQRWNGAWPMNENLQEVKVSTPNTNWKYNTPYTIKLEKVKDLITGTVHDLDGNLLFEKVFKFKDDTPVNAVVAALRNERNSVVFTNIDVVTGKPLEIREQKQTFAPYSSNSFIPGKTTKPTGFFHVKQDPDGTWWTYDPLGRAMVTFGIDWVSYSGHHCEKLGRFLHREYNQKRFKTKAEWEDETVQRLTGWGFNMIMGSDPKLRYRGLSHSQTINVGGPMASLGDEYDITPNEQRPCTAFPNVFHPKFKSWCEYKIRDICSGEVNNPWLFGYFIDNELAWWGRGSNYGGLFDAAMKKNPKHHAKIFIRDLLAKHADNSIDKLNKTWNLNLTSFDQLLHMDKLPDATDEQKAIKEDFLRQAAEIYFSTVSSTFRKIDPNHMLMGCRFAGIYGNHPIVWEVAGKYSDIVTWNFYGSIDMDEKVAYDNLSKQRKPVPEAFTEVYKLVKRPALITEWSFPALDSGLPCTYGAGQRFLTQKERAEATGIFAKTILSLPFIIGYDYFMWVDQPPLGISTPFPENTNYGLINLKGEPYPDIVKTLSDIQLNPAKARLNPVPPARKFTPPPEKLYDKYLAQLPRMNRSAMNPAFSVKQTSPVNFVASNGRLTFDTQNGTDFVIVKLDGKTYAQFGSLVHFIDHEGRESWQDIQKITNATIVANQEKMVIELTGEAQYKASDMAFEISFRIVALPNQDWFFAQVNSVKNIGATPSALKAVFIRYFPFFDGARESTDDLTYASVPNLWTVVKSSGYVSADTKHYIGATVGRHLDANLNCWKSKTGNTFYPDLARRFEDTPLPKGATYVPDTPFYLTMFAGKGNLRTMLFKASKLWE